MPKLDVTLIIALPTMQMVYVLLHQVHVALSLCWIYALSMVSKMTSYKLYSCKSSCLVVKPSRFQLKCPDVYINHNKLDYVVKVKYLGVIICDNMKDDEYMIRHLRSFYARSNSILRKCHNCSVDVKLYLFHAYCCTIYCSQLWVNFKKSTYAKLKVAYNNMHRRILGYNRWDSASNMFVSNVIDNFDANLRKNNI